MNTVRGLLREFGVAIPVGARNVVPQVRRLTDEVESTLPEILHPALLEACDEIRQLEQRLGAVERQLKLLARQIPVVKRLLLIPGIGVISATALVAFVGDVQRFPSGRHSLRNVTL